MPNARQERIRHWHLRRVLTPFLIRPENMGEGWYFMRKLEGRWSASRRKWLWRRPRDNQRANPGFSA